MCNCFNWYIVRSEMGWWICQPAQPSATIALHEFWTASYQECQDQTAWSDRNFLWCKGDGLWNAEAASLGARKAVNVLEGLILSFTQQAWQDGRMHAQNLNGRGQFQAISSWINISNAAFGTAREALEKNTCNKKGAEGRRLGVCTRTAIIMRHSWAPGWDFY